MIAEGTQQPRKSRLSRQDDARATGGVATDPPAHASAIRRFFSAWRSGEKLLDYGLYDYALDRIGHLENRVMGLERARNAAPVPRIAPDDVALPGETFRI